ncbi:hypothetical protein B0H19DRAFT_1068336 [Mycena capillaripes]|nr:hypothetical protein B0H19DRAFT_1068336 [Mycena capillaripes]
MDKHNQARAVNTTPLVSQFNADQKITKLKLGLDGERESGIEMYEVNERQRSIRASKKHSNRSLGHGEHEAKTNGWERMVKIDRERFASSRKVVPSQALPAMPLVRVKTLLVCDKTPWEEFGILKQDSETFWMCLRRKPGPRASPLGEKGEIAYFGVKWLIWT